MKEMCQTEDQNGETSFICVRNRTDVIYNFQVCFFAMRPLQAFPWNLIENELENNSSSEILLDIVKQTCLHPLCRERPPSVKYRRRFLFHLIKLHEASASEPQDGLYDALGEVLGTEEGPECYKSYLLPCGEAVTLSESVAVISEGTTGLVTWEAALYLAEWALESTHVFTGRTVLELGSGVGLTGIAVCRSCRPSKYVFSDYHHSVLQRLRDNLQLNGLDNQNSKEVKVFGSVANQNPPRLCNREDVVVANQNPPRLCNSEDVVVSNQNPPRLCNSEDVVVANQNPPRLCNREDVVVANQNPPRLCNSEDVVVANQIPPRVGVSVKDLDWKKVTEEQLRDLGINTVIAADVVYDPDIIGCLVELLSKILRCSANGSPPDIYISSTIRNPDTYNSFKKHLANAGIRHEVMSGPVNKVFHYNRLSSRIELIQLHL